MYSLRSYLIPSFVCAAFFVPLCGSAQMSGTLPFGGNVLSYIECTCQDNYLVFIGPPNEGEYIYQPGVGGVGGTDLREWDSILVPGVNALGLAIEGDMTCLVDAGPYCTDVGAGPMMLLVGTSEP